MKIYITEEQRNLLNEAMEINNTLPQVPAHLLQDNSNPLLNCPSLPNGSIEKLLAKRFIEVKSEFSDDISEYDNKTILTKLSKLISKCLKKESKIQSQLEDLCTHILTESFNIPKDGVEISCTLSTEISQATQFHITPDTDEDIEYENYAAMEQEDSDTKKRELTNALIVGGAIKLSYEILKKYISNIFELDEELPHLYSEIMKINDYLLFSQKFEIKDNSHKQGGYVTVKMGNETTPTKIEATAVIFPILLIESLRGCLELWASHGLPDDINKAKSVINKADALVNDPWYTRIGPVLWNKIYNGFDLKYLPTFFSNLSELPNEDFFGILKECFANTKLGKKEIEKLVSKSKYEDDYSSFEYDIKQKQLDKGIIEDGYFTEEELNEATYPENFNMDYFKSLTSFNARIRYCETFLQRISSGSSRIVYKIDENTVLKLAKNQKGIAQNEVEGQHDCYRDNMNMFAKIYDTDENYLWIEMQLAKKARVSDFKRLTGYDFNTVCYWIDYCKPDRYRNSNPLKTFFDSPEFEENWDEYGLLAELQEYIGNYDVPIGDLKRISSWGVVNGEYGEELVLIDYGLTNDVFNNYYKRW